MDERATEALAPADSAFDRDCESANPALVTELVFCDETTPLLVAELWLEESLTPVLDAWLRDVESARPALTASLRVCESASPLLVAADVLAEIAFDTDPGSVDENCHPAARSAGTKLFGHETVFVALTTSLDPSG